MTTSPSRFRRVDVARVKAVLRRGDPHISAGSVELGGLSLVPQTRQALVGSDPICLGPTEFRLLHFLMTHAERVHSHDCWITSGVAVPTSRSAQSMCIFDDCAVFWNPMRWMAWFKRSVVSAIAFRSFQKTFDAFFDAALPANRRPAFLWIFLFCRFLIAC